MPPDAVAELGAKSVDSVLLTHHHRDIVRFAGEYRAKKVLKARREGVGGLPDAGERPASSGRNRSAANSRTAYFVLPEGVEGVDCSLTDGKTFAFGNWNVTPVAPPGHSRDHFAFLVEPVRDEGPRYLFAGDALHSRANSGRYTTDWDHWTDIGLKPTAESLRKLAKLNATLVLPHGPVIKDDYRAKVLNGHRGGGGRGRVHEELRAATRNSASRTNRNTTSSCRRRWSRAPARSRGRRLRRSCGSPGTLTCSSRRRATALSSTRGASGSADQVAKLQKDEKLGLVELVAFSHAHYDHFDGIHVLGGGRQVRGVVARPGRGSAEGSEPLPRCSSTRARSSSRRS